MAITHRGLITGPEAILAQLPAGAFKVTSWQNGRSPKTAAETYAKLKSLNACAESIFDAAHGFRYMLFVYTTRDERRACWSHHVGE